MEYEKCYVYQPDDDRPAKRKRTELQGLQTTWALRKKAYHEAWSAQQRRIEETLNTINATTVGEVVTFLDQSVAVDCTGRIPTGLILAGPNSALRNSIASQVSSRSDSTTRRIFISLSSGSGSNLKAFLKSINQKATSRTIAVDDEDELEEVLTSRKGPKLLNYDLQILYDYVQERSLEQVVIAFEDTEAF